MTAVEPMSHATHHRPTFWLSLLGAETRYYDAGGVRTRCIQAGTHGKPLILMHGIGGHAEAFARNVVPLGANFRTFAIDCLGHGLSDGTEGPLTKEAYVRHLIDFMDAVGIEKAHVLGESLGGWIAMWASLLHPERIDKIVFTVGAKLEVPVPEAAAQRTAAGRAELTRLTRQFLDEPSRENVRERLKWLFRNPARDLTEELVDLRWALYCRTEATGQRGHSGSAPRDDGQLTPDRLRTIVHPTLVLWTDHNPSASVAEAREATSYLPNAELTIMEDSGHWPQWEHPETFNEIVRAYLQRVR